MDKKQPDLDAPIANQLLFKLPFAALLSDDSEKVIWCNETFLQLVKTSASDIIEQVKPDVENLYFKHLPDHAEHLVMLDRDSGKPIYWLHKQETTLDTPPLTLNTY
jgi:hypothetical protein